MIKEINRLFMVKVEKGGVPEELREYDVNNDGKLDTVEAKTAVEMEMAEGDVEGTRAAVAASEEATLREQEDRAMAKGMKEIAAKEAADAPEEEKEDVKKEEPGAYTPPVAGPRTVAGLVAMGLAARAATKPFRWFADKVNGVFYGALKSWDDEGLKILERTDVLKPEEPKDGK